MARRPLLEAVRERVYRDGAGEVVWVPPCKQAQHEHEGPYGKTVVTVDMLPRFKVEGFWNAVPLLIDVWVSPGCPICGVRCVCLLEVSGRYVGGGSVTSGEVFVEE